MKTLEIKISEGTLKWGVHKIVWRHNGKVIYKDYCFGFIKIRTNPKNEYEKIHPNRFFSR